jgi:hypothetical protein
LRGDVRRIVTVGDDGRRRRAAGGPGAVQEFVHVRMSSQRPQREKEDLRRDCLARQKERTREGATTTEAFCSFVRRRQERMPGGRGLPGAHFCDVS